MKQNTTIHFINIILISGFFLFSYCNRPNKKPFNIYPNKVVPTQRQIDYQQMELLGFIHFTTNTFTGKEWGYGDENPSVFNPTDLDVEQWVITAKNAGIKELILTAKHHDGFCLWPSNYTDHSIKNSPYKNGEGDIVKEFTDACKKHGVKAGLYLSPWDRNHSGYGKPEYVEYYKNQITELLSNYGEINEIWFDGANGGDGYYGGANETRKIDSKTYYGWDEIFALAKKLQPDIKIFSDAGPDVHWIGNEQGFAGDPFWSTITCDSIPIGKSNPAYLNSGDPEGINWVVGQCDVSIRPGWFYHPEEDTLVKTPDQLMDIYYKSVGRNAVLLLNLPPDQRGLIHENDIISLQHFREILDSTFSTNLVKEASVTASNYRQNHSKLSAGNIIDTCSQSYWATDDSIKTATLIFELPKEEQFDIFVIQEPIKFGQRISSFEIDILDEKGTWKTLFKGNTIGYKRIVKTDLVKAKIIRLKLLAANNTIAVSNFELYRSSETSTFRNEK